ncbi:M24 family metallopeptidase [Candidatus Woesearchaeota archaeon]|nr:M24 family metallopeptidase [Candidatus Woesearchaeota archaeon]
MSLKYSRKSCSIASGIIKKTIRELENKSFKTELDVYNFLKKETCQNKCRLAFKPIVAFGKNAAEIHHKAKKTKLGKGFLVIDFGVKYRGICSDMTRTVYIGTPSKKEKRLYNLVLLAQETAMRYACAGEYAANIDLVARAVLWDYWKHFVHGTGHGVGRKIHQAPSLKPRGRAILKKGDVITIEPGLYFKNKLGIRVEDTILIKENQPEILTKVDKKLKIIKD